MHESHGDLLIGGQRIKHVHCELEEEQPLTDSKEWNLAGHLHLTSEQSKLLETDRPYRLQLEDGRAGQVVVSQIAEDDNPDDSVVAFLPKKAAK
jgi:hypothetical protein